HRSQAEEAPHLASRRGGGLVDSSVLHPSWPRAIRTEAPPDPLPETWARAVANSIASELRRGWRAHTVKRAVSSLGAPITGRDYAPAGRLPGPAPTWELVSRELFAW